MSIEQQQQAVPLNAQAVDHVVVQAPGIEPNAPDTVEVYHDTLEFDTSVIEKIIGLNAREVPGLLGMKGSFVSDLTESFISSARPTKGITADVNGQDVYVEIKTILEYGASGPEVFATLSEKLRATLLQMTGLTLRDLNMRVVDVMSRQDYEEANQKDREQAAREQQAYYQQPNPTRYQ